MSHKKIKQKQQQQPHEVSEGEERHQSEERLSWPQTANISHHNKTPLNKKATCQTSSSSPPPTSSPFSPFPDPHFLVCDGAVTERGLELHTPPAALSLHSSATFTSSFCLFLLVFMSPQSLQSTLNRINEDEPL